LYCHEFSAVPLPGRSRATKYLALFFLSIAAVFSSHAVAYSTLDGKIYVFSWLLLNSVLPGTVALIAFAYHFPKNIHPRESRIVLGPGLALALAVWIYTSYEIQLKPPVFRFEISAYNHHEWLNGVFIGLGIIWANVVMLRKAAAYSDHEYRGRFQKYLETPATFYPVGLLARFVASISTIIHADNRFARAHRGFVLIFSGALLLNVFTLLSSHGLISPRLFNFS